MQLKHPWLWGLAFMVIAVLAVAGTILWKYGGW